MSQLISSTLLRLVVASNSLYLQPLSGFSLDQPYVQHHPVRIQCTLSISHSRLRDQQSGQ